MGAKLKNVYFFLAEYLLLFMKAAFIGWLYEIICVNIIYGRYIDRGVLHLPFCPIYGFGMLILYVILHKVKNNWIILGASILITTGVELITSYVAQYAYHVILWTYEDWPLNFQGRISAVSSCIFGIMALFVFRIIRPGVRKVFDGRLKMYVAAMTIITFAACIIWEIRFL